MKKGKKKEHKEPDPNLDIPAEANRTKHINFMEIEEESSQKTGINNEDWVTERQKQWKKGLEEGREAFDNE